MATAPSRFSMVVTTSVTGNRAAAFNRLAAPPRQALGFQTPARLASFASAVAEQRRPSAPNRPRPSSASSSACTKPPSAIAASVQPTQYSTCEIASALPPVLQSFKCPITLEVMREPVMTQDGQVYKRDAIQEWFRRGHRTSPVTGVELSNLALLPGFSLKRAIDEYEQLRQDLGGLIVEPKNIYSMSDSQLARVRNLTFRRVDCGLVVFPGETDCREILHDFHNILMLRHGEVVAYPNQTKPPAGQGLNKPAEITLYGCHPKGPIQTEEAARRYKSRVKQMTEDRGAEFIDYDPVQGTWKFRVKQFGAESQA